MSTTSCNRLIFQPTLPVRGATESIRRSGRTLCISTHAPRAGSDGPHSTKACAICDFNPRSPCGERLHRPYTAAPPIAPFQPTLPVRGATNQMPDPPPGADISTHAPRAGSDAWPTRRRSRTWDFNPRSPCGERRPTPSPTNATRIFQPTLPVRGATAKPTNALIGGSNFNPRSPCGERPAQPENRAPRNGFQPTLPVRGATEDWKAGEYDVLFQPTLPVRGATRMKKNRAAGRRFQPTLPVRGATPLCVRH